MVVKFRARRISQGARKLVWTPTLIKKKKTFWSCSIDVQNLEIKSRVQLLYDLFLIEKLEIRF